MSTKRIQLDHADRKEVILQLKFALSYANKIEIRVCKKIDAKGIGTKGRKSNALLKLFPINPYKKFLGKNVFVNAIMANELLRITDGIDIAYILPEDVNQRVGIYVS